MSVPTIFSSPPEWTDRARCAEANPEDFFPDQGSHAKQAKLICGSCEVSTECLTYALENREPFGVWGGLNESERARLLTREAS